MEKLDKKILEEINGGRIRWACFSPDEITDPEEGDICVLNPHYGSTDWNDIIALGAMTRSFKYTNGEWVETSLNRI